MLFISPEGRREVNVRFSDEEGEDFHLRGLKGRKEFADSPRLASLRLSKGAIRTLGLIYAHGDTAARAGQPVPPERLRDLTIGVVGLDVLRTHLSKVSRDATITVEPPAPGVRKKRGRELRLASLSLGH